MKKAKPVFESFNDFVKTMNEAMNEAESSTSEGGAKINPIGDTGISLVTFTENTSFGAKDNKPYILLISDSIEFMSYLNNKTVKVELSPDAMELKYSGVKRREITGESKLSASSEKTGNTTVIYNPTSERNPDTEASINILDAAVGALYGPLQINKQNVAKLIKAMTIIRDEKKYLLSKNSLFNNLYKRLSIINNNMKTSQDLAKEIKGNRPSNLVALFDGIKEGFKS